MLGEFAETILFPRMGEMMDERFGQFEKQFEKKMDVRFAEQEYRLKDYIDTKFTNFTGELITRLDKRYVLKV